MNNFTTPSRAFDESLDILLRNVVPFLNQSISQSVQCRNWRMSGQGSLSHYVQTCSMGFRFGQQAGHSSVVVPASCRNALVSRATWGCALSCCRRNPSQWTARMVPRSRGEYPWCIWQRSLNGSSKYGVPFSHHIGYHPIPFLSVRRNSTCEQNEAVGIEYHLFSTLVDVHPDSAT